ncbi:MAG: 1-acyl-sn-glycerol-3-phosphate acyltransferase [gamma proteobacterium symbiont of Bathyaustriella thionipta]|nr:1-acyl-sn-glycerol-3-phosphate acyltransferase [gamma proteobacterium symbiont of Bathyaustriella thionipta]
MTAILLTIISSLLLLTLWLRSIGKRHQQIDWGSPFLNSLDGISRAFCLHYHHLDAHFQLALPEQGPAILVSNHISGLDPILLIAASKRPLRFMIAREQYERFGLRWLFKAVGCIPVDRDRNPGKALQAAMQTLRNGEVIALFPQGGIHLPHYQPRKLKRGVVRLAHDTHCPLLATHISGVTAPGNVVLPVFLRGHVQIESCQPIQSADFNADELLQKIADCIGHQHPHN